MTQTNIVQQISMKEKFFFFHVCFPESWDAIMVTSIRAVSFAHKLKARDWRWLSNSMDWVNDAFETAIGALYYQVCEKEKQYL